MIRNKTETEGFPPVALHSIPVLNKRDERSKRTPVPSPPGQGFFFGVFLWSSVPAPLLTRASDQINPLKTDRYSQPNAPRMIE